MRRWYLSLNHDGAMAVDSGGDSVCGGVHGRDEKGVTVGWCFYIAFSAFPIIHYQY